MWRLCIYIYIEREREFHAISMTIRMMIYHECIIAYIGSWWIKVRLNIFPSLQETHCQYFAAKQTNFIYSCNISGVQSQVASYQKLLKWYLIPLCLTLSNIRYVSRVEWSNPRKGAVPSPTPRCSSYWKGSLLVALDLCRQLHLLFLVASYIFHI